MVKAYLPKIKAQTAKSMAKNLLTTKGGKKITDTKFKEFLKKDKDLNKFAYKGKGSTLAKHQAKKFFGKVTGSAKQSGNLKVSATAAKKMGIRIDKKGQISEIGLNKIYQKATTEELSTQAKPTAPSPAELRREKRHENAMQTMHKRDRAEDIRKEQKSEQQPNKEEKSTATTPPPRSAGVSSTGAATGSQAAGTASQSSSGQRKTTQAGPALPSLLILPLNNLSKNVRGLDWTARKIGNSITQTLNSIKIFSIIDQDAINDAFYKLHIDISATPFDESTIKQAAEKTGAELFVTGYIKKVDRFLEIKIQMVNTITNQRLNLAAIKEETDDVFHLERKINWQIINALKSDAKIPDQDSPGIDEAVDLPI